MPDTGNNIPLPRGVWVDLYGTSGVAPGGQMQLQNLGKSAVLLVTASSEPPAPTDVVGMNRCHPGETLVNDGNSSGEWVISLNNDGLVNVTGVA